MTNRGLSINLLATPYGVDTYLVRLDCVDGSSLSEGDPLEDFRLGMFLRRLKEDDQFARVEHEGYTFVQLPASDWIPETRRYNDIYGLPLPLEPTLPVERIDINVRQHMNISNTPETDDRVNGFRIATPEIFERTKSGAEAFGIFAFGWDPRTHIMMMRPGEFGTTGTIDISAQNHQIKFIKLGFDFFFHPVCFVADRNGLRNGLRNYENLDHRVEWSADEYMQSQSIYDRSPYNTMAWSEVRRDGSAMELKTHPGLCALKGDRIDGLGVRLGELGVLRITRGAFEGKRVWNVFLQMPKPKVGPLRKFSKQ